MCRPDYVRWLRQDTEYLKTYYGAHSAKRLAQLLNRTEFAVKAKARELNLGSARRAARAYIQQQNPELQQPFYQQLCQLPAHPHLMRGRWSAFDTLRLLLLYRVMDDERLSRILQRSVGAMISRRAWLGWNREQACQARQLLTPMKENWILQLAASTQEALPEALLQSLQIYPKEHWCIHQ